MYAEITVSNTSIRGGFSDYLDDNLIQKHFSRKKNIIFFL
jgi:hypothetical protein